MNLLLIPVSPDAAATFARVLLAVLFLAHGVPKMKNMKGTVDFVRGTGFPGGAVFAVLFTLLEFFGAIAMLLGFLVQILAILFTLQMVATSIFAKTKLGKKYTGGYELDVLFLVLAITVALLGPGPWSVDRLLGLG
jgi:uncharacterized membrane protein YphA (DoxX/SURF4 family)